MQITVADIDRLNPPKEAEDLIRLAAEHGHQMWAGKGATGTAFQLRVTGPGWDVMADWVRPADAQPALRSVLLWQDATGKWTALSDLDAVRTWIGKDRS